MKANLTSSRRPESVDLTTVPSQLSWAELLKRFLSGHDNPNTPVDWYHDELETRIMPISSKEMPDELRLNKTWIMSFPSDKCRADELMDSTRFWGISEFGYRIGISGWNYVQRVAEHVTFEFDHGDDHNDALTTEELESLADSLGGSCEVRRSTRGKGLHCRVKLAEPVPVKNHSEYGELCRYTLAKLGKQLGIDLPSMACGVGCILWIWSRDATPENRGFELLYPQAEDFVADPDWRNQVPGQAVRVSKNKTVELDDEHQGLADWLEEQGYPFYRRSFEGGECFGTHTCGLQKAYTQLKLRGSFSTVSRGTDPSEPNCYMIPKEGGAWQVFRYGTADEPDWTQRQSDGHSWCWFNQFDTCSGDDWSELCVRFDGTRKHADRGKAYVLPNFESAASVVNHAGSSISDPSISEREVTLTLDGRTIYCSMERIGDEATPKGWSKLTQKKFGCSTSLPGTTVDRSDDSLMENIRICYHVSETVQQEASTEFFVRHDDGTWKCETKDNVRLLLRSQGCSADAADKLIGSEIRSPWKISADPFREEYPEPGVWNRGFKFSCDPEEGEYPHWRMILDHTGSGIDQAVLEDAWCQEHGIRTGGDFLFAYFAIMAQAPERRTPYLFLQSAENASGKSTLTDAIKLLLDDGAVVAADYALTNQQGFNRELVGGVVFTINETDLSRAGEAAYSKLKEYVTNPEITIHPKGGTPFKTKNWSRCIQTANDLSHCPVGFDDERVIVIELTKIPAEEVLDWETKLKPKLMEQRGHFLHALLNYELPPVAPGSRCFLPILSTDAKAVTIESNLPTLNEDQEKWCHRTIDLAQKGEWKGLKTFDEFSPRIKGGPSNPSSWRAAWNKMEPHFRNAGLNPIKRAFVKSGPNKGAAAWGFQK